MSRSNLGGNQLAIIYFPYITIIRGGGEELVALIALNIVNNCRFLGLKE
jgi:hypothetical protein